MIVNKIQTQIVAAIVTVVLVSLTAAYFFIEFRVTEELQQDIETNACDLLDSAVNIIDSQYLNILAYREQVLIKQKSELKSHTDIIFSLFAEVYHSYKIGELTEQEAKDEIVRYINSIRYNNGIGYFWINTSEKPYPHMIVHPTFPDLNGIVLDSPEFNISNKNRTNLFVEFVNICLKRGDGFLEYKWPKPVAGGVSKNQLKISYVRLFKPWGWIVGTGAYIDDIEMDFDRQLSSVIVNINKVLSRQSLGKTGYFFIFNEKDKMLVHPSLEGQDVSSLIDLETGKHLIDEFKAVSRKKNHSMEYLWNKPGDEDNFFHLKKAFIYYYEPLEWYIGASFYKDDFELIISKLTGLILAVFLFFIVVSFLVSVIIARRLVAPLNRLILEVGNLNSDGSFPGYFSESGPEEIKLLGSALNRMLNSTRKSQEHYKNLFNNDLVGIFRIRLGDGIFLDANLKVAELLGIPIEDIVGKLSTTALYKDPEDRDEILRLLNRDGEVIGYEFDMITPDGKEVTYTNSIKIYPEEDYLEGIVIDISRIKLAEKEKEGLQEQLIHRGKIDAIGQLAGGIAHDFNNMLSGIMGAAQLLNSPKRKLDEKSIQLVDIILSASSRAADLTSKLLSFGRKTQIVKKTIDIDTIIDDSVAIIEKTIDKKISITVNKEAQDHFLLGDYSALQNALMNILINASHAMTSGGDLFIETKNLIFDQIYCSKSPFDLEPGNYIQLSVKDTGCGIPSENMAKIFDPFFTTKATGRGTGLGLSSVYGMILNHHGSIRVFSKEGSGTEFKICFPCFSQKEELSLPESQRLKGEGTILLIDDEEFIRTTGKELLEDMGYTVFLAEDGKEAVELFQKEFKTIDLIIMDMSMPRMNGSEAFYKLKEIDKDCKIIIFSGLAKNANLDILLKDGLDGFINKPFKADELSRLIYKILNQTS